MLICPECNIPLTGMEYEGVTVHLCPDCRGVLVEEDRAEAIRKRPERTWSEAQRQQISVQVVRADRKHRVRCPRCLMKMKKVKVESESATFHLDRCKECGILWFDRGELDLVQIEYETERERRGADDLDRLERQALAEMQLDEHKRTTLSGGESDPTSIRAGAGGVIFAGGLGPQRMAAAAASWAARNLAEGLAEDVPERRRGALLKVLIGLLIVAALAALCVWLRRIW